MHITTHLNSPMRRAAGPKSPENVECFFSRPAHPSHVGGRRQGRRAAVCFPPVFTVRAQNSRPTRAPNPGDVESICCAGGAVLVALCVAFAGADASGVQRLWLFSEDGGRVAPPQRWWRRVIRRTTLMGCFCMWASAFASRHLSFQMKASQPFLQFQRISKLAKESSEKCRLSAAV